MESQSAAASDLIMRSLAVADWLSMFAAERIWSSYFSETRPMAPALLALVFGFNIKPTHSAVDMGNQSASACELFCIVCDTYSTSLSFATCFAGSRSLKLVIKYQLGLHRNVRVIAKCNVCISAIQLFYIQTCPCFFPISKKIIYLSDARISKKWVLESVL